MSQPADQGEVVDIDGDGHPDTAWLASPGNGGRELGVVTAAGGGDKVAIDSASPVELSLLVVDARRRAARRALRQRQPHRAALDLRRLQAAAGHQPPG